MRDSHNQTITQQEGVSLQTANLISQGAKRAGVQGTTVHLKGILANLRISQNHSQKFHVP